jgi:hypothetical protein
MNIKIEAVMIKMKFLQNMDNTIRVTAETRRECHKIPIIPLSLNLKTLLV